jgi:hypothetical protein
MKKAVKTVYKEFMENLSLSLIKKVPEARRVKNPRMEAYLSSTSNERFERNEAYGPFSAGS